METSKGPVFPESSGFVPNSVFSLWNPWTFGANVDVVSVLEQDSPNRRMVKGAASALANTEEMTASLADFYTSWIDFAYVLDNGICTKQEWNVVLRSHGYTLNKQKKLRPVIRPSGYESEMKVNAIPLSELSRLKEIIKAYRTSKWIQENPSNV